MEKVEPTGRSILRIAWLAAALAVATIAAFWIQAEQARRETWTQASRSKAQDQVNLLASGLRGVIDRNIQLAQGLVAVVSFEPGLDQEKFAQLGARILSKSAEVRVVAAAPDFVIRLIYPLRGNEPALGLNYRDYPDQMSAARAARDLGVTMVTGPVHLLQGIDAFVARSPVFVDGGDGRERRFWGVISMVLDPEAIYAAAGLDDPGLLVQTALSRRDGAGKGGVFRGDASILDQNPVTTRVALPFGAWELAAVPRGGWPPPPPEWGYRIASALGTLAVALAILGAGRVAATRERELERAKELSRLSWRLELALAASNVGVWDVELATDRLSWDDRVRTLWGFPPREGYFSEADWLSRLHPDDRDRALDEAREAVTASGRFVSEYRIVRPDGAVRHIRDTASVYEAPDGTQRLVGLLWDVTTDVERQEELNLRRIEAEAATVAKSRFLAAMSHEIRTPMSGVLGLLGLMLEEPLSKPQRERAEIALASARGLLRILNDILDFSKMEANLVRISEEAVAIRPLIDDVAALMAAGATQKGISLTCSVADNVPEVVVTDAMRLRQILTNLVSNATKFTEAGSIRIRVDAAPRGDMLRFEVGDTGIGIAPEHLGAVFDEFVQIDSSLTRRTGGTGLGLAVCKQLTGLLGGTIGVESSPDEGSIFTFTIRATHETAKPAIEASNPAPENASSAPLRVLLAEDNSTNRYLITAFLQAAGHTITAVGNGADAVSAAATGGFDVVLMDVQMPLLDGLSATRAIRALPEPSSKVAIIALTANAMSGDREQCIAAGMDDYLSKPVEAGALARALGRVQPGRALRTARRAAG